MIPSLVSMSALLPLVSDKNAPRTKGRVGSTGCSLVDGQKARPMGNSTSQAYGI